MKFCSQCGNNVEHKIPDADNRLRFVCVACETIHYQNPNIVAGTIPVYGDKILLCKRAIEPRYGFWTLPAGFMENKEAIVEIDSLFSMINVPQIDQVHIFFLARLLEPKYAAGSESLEVELFSEEEIPWEEIAFPTVKRTLKLFLEDRQKGSFGMHVADIIR